MIVQDEKFNENNIITIEDDNGSLIIKTIAPLYLNEQINF